MLFLPQGANNQSKSSKETNLIQRFDKNEVFQPYGEKPTVNTKPPKNIILGSKSMKRVKDYLRDVNGTKKKKKLNLVGF